MDIAPQIFTGKVMHKRLFPKENSFTYGIYYLVLPLPAPDIPSRLMQFHKEDLGHRDGRDPGSFAWETLAAYGLDQDIRDIMLVTMPRVLGYVFNPVSFYICMDAQGALRTVLAEVHNTFGEQHIYVCAHPDHAPIQANDWLVAQKLFHVSPFLARDGEYRFRFSLKGHKLGISIDYFDSQANKQLITSMVGTLSPMTKLSLRRAFWMHPLVTFKAIALIHMQALKLMAKKVRYRTKPPQKDVRVSATCERTLEKGNPRDICK